MFVIGLIIGFLLGIVTISLLATVKISDLESENSFLWKYVNEDLKETLSKLKSEE